MPDRDGELEAEAVRIMEVEKFAVVVMSAIPEGWTATVFVAPPGGKVSVLSNMDEPHRVKVLEQHLEGLRG